MNNRAILKLIFCITFITLSINVTKAATDLDSHRLFISFNIQGENNDSFNYLITKEPVEDDNAYIDYTIQNPSASILVGHSPVPAVLFWPSLPMDIGYLRTVKITITNENSNKEIYAAEIFYYPAKNWTKVQVEKLDPGYFITQSLETAIDIHSNHQMVPTLTFSVISINTDTALAYKGR